MGEWDREDNPLTEHRNLFPHCPFMRGQDVGNVPIVVVDLEGGAADSADSDIDPTTSGAGGQDEVRNLFNVISAAVTVQCFSDIVTTDNTYFGKSLNVTFFKNRNRLKTSAHLKSTDTVVMV